MESARLYPKMSPFALRLHLTPIRIPHQAPTQKLASEPRILKERFLALQNLSELAALLEISETDISKYAYGRRHKYRVFRVRKRRSSHEFREIFEPLGGLKIIQQKLNQVFRAVYEPRPYVQGFAEGRSVATNAQIHAGQRWVLNIDLENFFPSISFGRVRGMLMARPYELPPNIATVVAQLCCHERLLPQGAPTSPVLSNMIATRLDSKLQKLARGYRCRYSRYADDITISSEREAFPRALAYHLGDDQFAPVEVGGALVHVIEENGFKINHSKVRLAHYSQHQEATGLTINRLPNVRRKYIRSIRAMLHAWDKFGHDLAEAEFFARWDTKARGPHARPVFKQIVKGKIDFLGMVRGYDDPIYDRLLQRYARVEGSFRPIPLSDRPRNHLQGPRDAIWIVYCWEEYNQGTGFELEGFGLVTCAHVLAEDGTGEIASDITLTQPRLGGRRISARVIQFDRDRDLAILVFDEPSGVMLRPKLGTPSIGQQIRAAGFPEHGPGHTIWEDHGTITGYWHHLASPRYLITVRVAGGASGGPVFDATGAVIGVVSHGEDSIERAVQGVRTRFGMIPLSLLSELPQPAVTE